MPVLAARLARSVRSIELEASLFDLSEEALCDARAAEARGDLNEALRFECAAYDILEAADKVADHLK